MHLNNKYYLLRHGEAVSNVKHIASSWSEKFNNPLTKRGRSEISRAAEKLKNKNIELIFASDLLRTKQTASIIAKILNSELKFDSSSTAFKKVKVVLDKKLREINFGMISGKPLDQWIHYFKTEKERVHNAPPKAESYAKVSRRVFKFLKDMERKHKNKNILIVSHQCPLNLLQWKVRGLSITEGIAKDKNRIQKAELRELN